LPYIEAKPIFGSVVAMLGGKKEVLEKKEGYYSLHELCSMSKVLEIQGSFFFYR
jgi:hypothetical protein